jgi:hypothetical protein
LTLTDGGWVRFRWIGRPILLVSPDRYPSLLLSGMHACFVIASNFIGAGGGDGAHLT